MQVRCYKYERRLRAATGKLGAQFFRRKARQPVGLGWRAEKELRVETCSSRETTRSARLCCCASSLACCAACASNAQHSAQPYNHTHNTRQQSRVSQSHLACIAARSYIIAPLKKRRAIHIGASQRAPSRDCGLASLGLRRARRILSAHGSSEERVAPPKPSLVASCSQLTRLLLARSQSFIFVRRVSPVSLAAVKDFT